MTVARRDVPAPVLSHLFQKAVMTELWPKPLQPKLCNPHLQTDIDE